MANTQSPELANEKSAANAPAPLGKVRWGICALLFFATTTNYIDRAILSVLFPILKHSPADGGLGWTKDDYGTIQTIFSGAYALGLFFAGGFIRRAGIKWGLFWAVVAWTVASRAHGLVAFIDPHASMNVFGQTMLTTVVAFCICRIFLGLSEAANFPAAIAATAEWFPKKERAFATGIFNCGSNVGAMIAPFVVPAIALAWGWSISFYITGILAVIWLVLWAMYYQSPQNHKKLTPAELAFIESDKDEKQPTVKLPWSQFFFRRQTIAFSIGKFLTDPIWWFYLFWVPDFLTEKFKIKVTDSAWPLVVIYTSTTVGSIYGGWLSSHLIKRGWTVNAARKVTMLAFALCVVPAFGAALVSNMWLAVALIALAASAHQGFSANIFTLVSDTVPKQGVSAVTGIGAMAGGIGSMIYQKSVGKILDATHNNYAVPFAIASSAYVIAVLFIHLLLPRLERMKLDNVPTTTGPTPLDP
ncbi:MAG TPA: MFS transporter [Phycisphaerae bacterium]|nr:MFS transporter [Phycisphaerae bacterium]